MDSDGAYYDGVIQNLVEPLAVQLRSTYVPIAVTGPGSGSVPVKNFNKFELQEFKNSCNFKF